MKVECLSCKKELNKSLNQIKKFPNHYCNNKCQQNFYYKNFIDNWLNGDEAGTISAGWQVQLSGHIRRYMLEHNNYKCSQCGWGKLHPDGRSPLHIDHIDGNAINNTFTNLRVLCPNCHSLTLNFGSRNKNSTRYITSTR
jgi:hypothetical protein